MPQRHFRHASIVIFLSIRGYNIDFIYYVSPTKSKGHLGEAAFEDINIAKIGTVSLFMHPRNLPKCRKNMPRTTAPRRYSTTGNATRQLLTDTMGQGRWAVRVNEGPKWCWTSYCIFSIPGIQERVTLVNILLVNLSLEKGKGRSIERSYKLWWVLLALWSPSICPLQGVLYDFDINVTAGWSVHSWWTADIRLSATLRNHRLCHSKCLSLAEW